MRAAWLVLLALLLSAPLSGQEAPSSSTDSLPEASASSSTEPSPTWERLEDLLTQLESEAMSSSADSAKLKASLEAARTELTALSSTLGESRTQASELSASLERCERSLALSEESLREAQVTARRRNIELWAWRAAAAIGLAAGAAGIVYGITN